MIIEVATTVGATPSKVFRFFEEMADNYERWHPDHITYRWVSGDGLTPGAEAYFEERIGGKVQRKTVEFTDVIQDRYIEFRPTSKFMRILLPSISFTIEPEGERAVLVQRIKVRTGPIGARLNRTEFEAVRVHMTEEGENLKRILEE